MQPHPLAAFPARRPRLRWLHRGVVAVVALGLSAAGCDRSASVRPGDIRTYTIPTNAEPAAVAARAPAPAAPATPGLTYQVPQGWTDAGPSGMRLATLLIGDPAAKDEVTIIPAAGTLESNVERWQGQLDEGADPAARSRAAADAVAAAETVDVDGTKATVVMLLAADEAAPGQAGGTAILGAMIPVDESAALFVKYKGSADVARRERENFVRFVSSIRWKPQP